MDNNGVLEPMEMLETLEVIDCVDVGKDVNSIKPKPEVDTGSESNTKENLSKQTQTVMGSNKTSMAINEHMALLPANQVGHAPKVGKPVAKHTGDNGTKFCCGCFLSFETTSEGTLFINWSENEIDVEGTYAYFTTTQKVPKFKFKQNGGKSELIRGFLGQSKGKYYQGWVQFVKLAREFKAILTMNFDDNIELYFLNGSNQVHPIPKGEAVEASDFIAVSAIPKDSNAYQGVATMTNDFFTGTGNKVGASLSF
mmetsp:Transcript_17091/g.20578  ORF Transcript_17091/g.20578 Transcript_17091/m.20578 type:complete len:254 (-) Transcript_17091:234-995(-)|eukprot:CAMPEP_0204831346 /NCGR_PEP_ID=MMETSP1346-20131115/10468_1 /ASSEMBLY_ACC=CAM_ASM_000771 /TAXON_ID=215587 /ORGANISM="Aplanochytrium stocchinoi, Strain GSBS06" /LENGTH=253 /DNA_ID=CAMNT_0051962337 /DNA_START=131 /DNA_END=892 /DNA_ORIENTATION=-